MASPPSASSFFRSLAAFRKRLSTQDIENFELTSFDDLKAAINDIQTKQAQRRGYRNLNKIKPFLHFLQQYARVIEQFVSAKPDFLAFIWGPIKLCLQIASRMADAFDSLLDAYARIGEALPIFSAVDDLFASRRHSHVQQILANVYEDILTFHQRAVLFFRQRTWTIAFQTTFRTFSDMFGDVVKNFERSKDLLIQTASVTHFQQAQDARLLITKEFEDLRKSEEQHRKLAVTNWLSHGSHNVQQEELRDRRLQFPDTTKWIFDMASFCDWMRSDESNSLLFWLCGIPGAGKTVLFSSIVDGISEKFPESCVVCFYCRENDPSKSTFINVITGLIGQILVLNQTCLHYLYEKTITSGEPNLSSTKLCIDIFETLAVHHDQLFVGIDGLDECEEPDRRRILDMINHILKISSTARNVRFFVTSRKEKDIEKALGSASKLEIRPHHLERDINSYVRKRVSELSEKFTILAEHQKQISADIAKRSYGMFLLARLILDNIMDQDCREDLDEELSSEILPKGINQAYGRILFRIQKRDRPDKTWKRAKLGLDLVIMATRSLKVHEIQGALSINLEVRDIQFEKRKSVKPLEELLGPIVEVHTDDSVNLIHPTARDYLLQKHSGHFIDPATAELRLAQLCASYLTFTCFNPLLDKFSIDLSVCRGDYSFQEYAAFNWIHHTKSFWNHRQIMTEIEIPHLEEPITLLNLHYLEQFSEQDSRPKSEKTRFDPSIISDGLGIWQAAYDRVDTINGNQMLPESMPYLLRRVLEVRTILEEHASGATKTRSLLTEAYGVSLFKCPLIQCPRFNRGFATRDLRDGHFKRHNRVHKCTFETCDYAELGFPTSGELTRHIRLCHDGSPGGFTFPSVKRVSANKALEDAIDRDDVLAVRDICSTLTEHPVEETGFLLRAVKKRKFNAALAIVELLGTEDEVNHQDRLERTALHEAVELDHGDLLQKILATDVNVNASDTHNQTPLSIALKRGYFHIVRLLLSCDSINLEQKHSGYQYVHVESFQRGFLQAASRGHRDVLQTILPVIVKFIFFGQESLSNFISRALSEAASNNHKSTVMLILKMGHDLDLEKHYRGLLQRELRNGIEAMTKLFMSRPKSKMNGKEEISGKELVEAAANGDSKKVIHLLRNGANIDFISGLKQTALTAATEKGQLSMVRLLLEKGADVNFQSRDQNGGQDGITALAAACHGGGTAIVQLLLEKGAIVNEEPWALERYKTPLLMASAQGHVAVVQLLLKAGAKVQTEVQTEFGTKKYSALKTAAGRGNQDVVRLLIGYGADVNMRDEFGVSALIAASLNGNETVVQLLLQNGAEVNMQDREHVSALIAASSSGHETIVQLLLQNGAEVNMQDQEYSSALTAASRKGNETIVRLLLERGAEVNMQGGYWGSALTAASFAGHDTIVRLLLETGADVNMGIGHWGSALVTASRHTYETTVLLLLQNGAEVDMQVGYWGSALIAASIYGQETIVQLLLETGAEVNLQAGNWGSALIAASSEGHEIIVRLLLLNGADVHARGPEGTALESATRSGHKSIVQILVQHEASNLEL